MVQFRTIAGICLFIVLQVGGAVPAAGFSASDFEVTVYDAERAMPGTTLLPVCFDAEEPKIMEFDMNGDLVWSYVFSDEEKKHLNPGLDAEVNADGTITVLFPLYGIKIMDRGKNTLWFFEDNKVTHDADLLPNGNVLTVFGGNDGHDDVQVKEIDKQGNVVMQWRAKDYFEYSPFSEADNGGWAHANTVVRRRDGGTLVSLRNFNLLALLDATGNVTETYGYGLVFSPHDPEFTTGGNILLASQMPLPGYVDMGDTPVNVVPVMEFDPQTEEVLFAWGTGAEWHGQLTRDTDRLANGNTLVTGTNRIVELSPQGEIVWELRFDYSLLEQKRRGRRGRRQNKGALGFYKAQRISSMPQRNPTGWWYDPEAPGTGVSLEVKDGKAFAAWYVYDESGKSVWYSSPASKQGDNAFSGDLSAWTGGDVQGEYGPAASMKAGEVLLGFGADEELFWTWDLNGKQGTAELSRYMDDIAQGLPDSRKLTGWWWDPVYAGTGFFLETKGSSLFTAWFLYRPDATPRWLTLSSGVGAFPDGTEMYAGTFQEWSGGQVPGGVLTAPEASEDGNVALMFQESGSIRLQSGDADLDLHRYDFTQ